MICYRDTYCIATCLYRDSRNIYHTISPSCGWAYETLQYVIVIIIWTARHCKTCRSSVLDRQYLHHGGWPNETLHYVIIIRNVKHNTISHDHVITHISYNIFIMWWLAKWNTTLCHYHMKWETQHNKSWSCDWQYLHHGVGQMKHYTMSLSYEMWNTTQ